MSGIMRIRFFLFDCSCLENVGTYFVHILNEYIIMCDKMTITLSAYYIK